MVERKGGGGGKKDRKKKREEHASAVGKKGQLFEKEIIGKKKGEQKPGKGWMPPSTGESQTVAATPKKEELCIQGQLGGVSSARRRRL